MFKTIKNIKIVVVVIKWLQVFCRYILMRSCMVAVYTVYGDAVIVSARYLQVLMSSVIIIKAQMHKK
jgi:hypothetical protein